MASKKEVLLELLSRSTAFVQLDGRAEGVELPEWLRGDPAVVLQLGYDLPIPIPDLTIDDQGITATLSFRRTPTRCRVPWSAVFAIADAEGHGAIFNREPGDKSPEPPPSNEPPAGAPRDKSPETPPDKPRRPSHLKLVK